MDTKIKKVSIILLSLIFLALLVTPNVYAEDIHHDSGTVNLPGDRYWGYHMSLPEGGGIKYTIKANNSVNVYLLDDANLQNYVSGRNFKYIEQGSALDVKSASIAVAINKSTGGDYYLIVESVDYKDVNFTYELTYGKDVEVSFLDFLTGLNTTFCLTSLVVLIIWLAVVVWVYKDAKRRGKSGVLWGFVTLILPLIGLIIWLIVRPKRKEGEVVYLQPPP